jgi:hypothetical protein
MHCGCLCGSRIKLIEVFTPKSKRASGVNSYKGLHDTIVTNDNSATTIG